MVVERRSFSHVRLGGGGCSLCGAAGGRPESGGLAATHRHLCFDTCREGGGCSRRSRTKVVSSGIRGNSSTTRLWPYESPRRDPCTRRGGSNGERARFPVHGSAAH